MRWAGYVPIRRGDKDSHGVAMQAAKERLHAGIAMFFFPEGTRSVDGRIKEFKTGAFRLAVENNVPIVPIALKGAGNLLPKGSWKPGRAHVSIKVLPPIAPSADIHALAIQARERIIAAHAGLGESKSGDA
jgi:1-acyl-sn-glycerol-3-phosphate acyltransferase